MARQRLSWKAALALGLAGVWLGRRLMRKRYNLAGRTVLVTGGSRGLGLALATAFGVRGARLALLGRDAAELTQAAAELRSSGVEVRVFPCDVRLSEQVQQAVRKVVETLGPIDVLVNNAGVIEIGPRDTMLLSDYQEAMDTHFFAPLSLVQTILPAMRARREGRIVNISSEGGKVPTPNRLPDVASKFALVGFSEGLHAEVKREGIVVTTVCPGLMRTGSARHLPFLFMGADAAARAIVRACELGKAEVILGGQAQATSRLHGLAPGLTSEALSWVARLMPRNVRAEGRGRQTGAESESPLTRSALTGLTREAELRNNELP